MRVEKDERSERHAKVILDRVPGYRSIEGSEWLTDARRGFALSNPLMGAVCVPFAAEKNGIYSHCLRITDFGESSPPLLSRRGFGLP